MPSTARQLRQPPTIEAIGRVPYFADEVIDIISNGIIISITKPHSIKVLISASIAYLSLVYS